jgi:hypothetical protein
LTLGGKLELQIEQLELDPVVLQELRGGGALLGVLG